MIDLISNNKLIVKGQDGLNMLVKMIEDSWKSGKDFTIEIYEEKDGRPAQIRFEKPLENIMN